MEELKRKEPLMALLLTVLIPGLGHVYAGKRDSGIKYFFSLILLPVMLSLYIAHPQTKTNLVMGYFMLVMLLFLMGLSIFILIDAYRCAKLFNIKHNIKTNISGTRKFLIVGCMIFFIFVFNPVSVVPAYVRTRLVQAFKMPAGSMVPTLMPGDRILVNKAIYRNSEPQRGDIIVFKDPDNPHIALVKRLAGLPGEKIELKKGELVINDEIIKGFAPKGGYYDAGGYGREGQAFQIPPGSYYVLGDNTLNSGDSRHWGYVPKENLIGKAYKIYYPFQRSGPIK